MDKKKLAPKIKAQREKLGMSQADLVELIKALDTESNLDQGMISRIESGTRKIDSDTELPLLAKALNKPISWFFEESDVPKDRDPVNALMERYFPGVEFSDFEMKRIAQFLEPVVNSYVKSDPKLSKKISQ